MVSAVRYISAIPLPYSGFLKKKATSAPQTANWPRPASKYKINQSAGYLNEINYKEKGVSVKVTFAEVPTIYQISYQVAFRRTIISDTKLGYKS